MPAQALLPDRRIANWVIESANAAMQGNRASASLP